MRKQPEDSWPATKVELRPLDKIIPYEKNPRVHGDAQVEMIAASMRDDGVTAPILVDDGGVIIFGHGRRLAALKNGYLQYPVSVAIGWSEEKKRAVRIKDNALAAASSWNAELLKIEITDLKMSGYNLPLLGFPESQLRAFGVSMGADGADPEATPDPPKHPIVRRGDLWMLGDHRLLCGDCIDQKDVARLMDGALLDLVFTDPPYNVAYSGLGQNRLGTIENDDQADDKFEAWLAEVFRAIALAMRVHACVYVCHPDSASAPKLAFERAFAANFKKSSTIIWVKQSAGMGWQDYRAQHEPILYGWRDGKKGKHFYSGDRAKTTVWQLNRDAQLSYVHPTQKPVALAEEAIFNSSKRGWKVGDFFAGSGSALIGCQAAGRQFYGMEIEPRFCEAIIERWENFCGADATLEGDGRTFKAVREDRGRQRPRTRQGSRAHRGSRPDPAGIPSVSQ